MADEVKVEQFKEEKDSKKKFRTLVEKVKKNPIKEVRELVTVTENAMQSRVVVWERYRKKYRRGMYYLKNLEGGVPLYFTNYIFSIVETTKANMTRNLPPLVCSPRGFRDDLSANIMTRLLQDALQQGGIKKATKTVVHYGLIETLGWFKVGYDVDNDALKISAHSPQDILCDPLAPTPDEARWIIHRKRDVSVDKIYAEYGERPSKKDKQDSENIYNEDRFGSHEGTYTSRHEMRDAADKSETYDVYECWIRDWAEDRENDWFIITVAGDTVLREEYSVYEHNLHPFIPWFDVEDDGADNVYHRGIGSIEEIEPLQDRADALDLRIYKNISLVANRQKYIASQSGLNVNQVDNTSGRTYQVNGDPSKAVFYDNPPMLSSDIYGYRNQTELLIQTVSGIFDVTQGRRPVGITAGRAIEALKDSAETRLAAKVDSLAETLERVGSLSLQIILQFFDGERMIKASDADEEHDYIVIGDYPEALHPPVEFDPETQEVIAEGEMTEEILQMRQQWKEENGITLVLSDITYKWDIKANTDSALPASKAERGQVAADLFRLGGIDRAALLEALDFPNRNKILQRIEGSVTGKDAGKEMQEGQQVEMILGAVTQILQQMGLPEEQIAQIVQGLMAQAEQRGQPQDGGNFPPQIAM